MRNRSPHHGRRGYTMRNRPSSPWEERLDYAQQDPLTLGERLVYAQRLLVPKEERLVYAQRLLVLRGDWSMRRGSSSLGGRLDSAQRLLVLRREARLCAEASSSLGERLDYAQRPPSLLRMGIPPYMPPSLLRWCIPSYMPPYCITLGLGEMEQKSHQYPE